MTDRIRELAIQTDIWCDQNYHNNEFYDIQWEQKFADLIVRECAKQVDWILAEGGKTQGDLIKEHFGIES